MTELQHLPRLSKGRRHALEELGVHDTDALLAFAGAVVADAVNRQRARTRTRPQDAVRWLVAAATGEHVEHVDPSAQDGWSDVATFTFYFQEREREGVHQRRVLVSHHERDGESEQWPGHDGMRALARVHERLAAEDDAAHPGETDPNEHGRQEEPAMTSTDDQTTAAPVVAPQPRFRTIDGSGNGGRDLGRAGRALLRLGLDASPFDPNAEPNPRSVSSLVCRQRGGGLDPLGRSEFVWAWGQFLDHELDLVEVEEENTPEADILVPDDDHRIEFRGTVIPFALSKRSEEGELTNSHTAYVDASNVYGTSKARLSRLRTGVGGKLKTSEGRLLPVNDASDEKDDDPSERALDGERRAEAMVRAEPMEGDRSDDADVPGRPLEFLAGDTRANEHCVLTALHTIFLREHNWWCDRLAERDPSLDDDDLFEGARKLVGAEMQVITYSEFLPALLGPDPLPPYRGFEPSVDPGISVLFASAGFRLGHSLVHDDVLLNPEGYSVRLADLFFAPEFVRRVGVERWLSQLAYREMHAVDPQIVDGLREFLFRNVQGNGSHQMLDLAALNIQRGREHGLHDFNACRRAERIDLPPVSDFHQLTDDPWLADRLEQAYGTIDRLDPWVGALAETPSEGRCVGDLLHATLVDQFTRLRDGDYYWYEHDPYLDSDDCARVRETTLGDIIRRNAAPVDGEPLVIPRHVFML